MLTKTICVCIMKIRIILPFYYHKTKKEENYMKNFIHHSAIRHSFPLLIRSMRAEDII